MKRSERPTVLGFTLLEMLVVMVLLGFVTSLALPAMQRWHDATQLRSRTAVIVDTLRVAALKAAASRRTLVMDERSFKPARGASEAASPAQATGAPTGDHLEVALPPGWTATRVLEARFLGNGLCQPGSALLTTERGEQVEVSVQGPLCAVEQRRASAT